MLLRTFLLCCIVTLQPIARTLAEPPGPASVAQSSREAELKQRLALAIDMTRRRYLSAEQHSPWQIVHGIIAFGRSFQIKGPPDAELVNAIDLLCNRSRFGQQPVFMPSDHGLRLFQGSGMEGHPDQFLSALAQAGVPLEQPLKVSDQAFRVADLVGQSQYNYSPGQEGSWTLISLSTYVPIDASWTNGYGRVMRIENLVSAEAAVDPTTAACGGTHNLYALAYAFDRYRAQGLQATGAWQRAAEKLARYRELTRSLQNEDGLFSSRYYRRRGWSGDSTRQLDTTGHTLEWLALALPEEQLKEEWVTRAVESLLDTFERTRTRPLDCGPLYHATHALVLYQKRRFGSPPASESTTSSSKADSSKGPEQAGRARSGVPDRDSAETKTPAR